MQLSRRDETPRSCFCVSWKILTLPICRFTTPFEAVIRGELRGFRLGSNLEVQIHIYGAPDRIAAAAQRALPFGLSLRSSELACGSVRTLRFKSLGGPVRYEKTPQAGSFRIWRARQDSNLRRIYVNSALCGQYRYRYLMSEP